MKPNIISSETARGILLRSQLLDGFVPKANKAGLYRIIRQLGYIQLDTISIIERAHKHILWTRMPGYDNKMLDTLIDKDKKVFEFWDHAAAYMPMEDFRFTLLRKKMYAQKHKEWAQKNKKLLNFIMDRIRNEGPLQSRDFEDTKKRGAWWDWKPAKDGLEFLFHSGRLVVKARKNFQKVYELPERMIPGHDNFIQPGYEEFAEHLIHKTLRSAGLASVKEITYLRHHDKKRTAETINRLLEEKVIMPVKIKEAENEIFYAYPKTLNTKNKKDGKELHILSPFDNAVIQRKRLSSLFNFNFTIEIYLPAEKRKFGYFLMPVLYGDKFCGKIDAKADRKSGSLVVINEFWENGFIPSADFKEKYIFKLNQLAEFSGCQSVIYQQKNRIF